jgi:uncharacterized protein YdhG (YjbR/CyaY superfamily)
MDKHTVTEYIEAQSEPQKSAIKRVYDIARRVAGTVEESESYGMPCLRYKGKQLISVMNTKNHIGIYPYSGFATSELAPKLTEFSTSSGTIRFTPDKPLSEELLEEIIAFRIHEIEAKGPGKK